MKNIVRYILILFAGVSIFACKPNDIPVFGNKHIIYFEKFWKDASFPGVEKADSIQTSFYFVDENVDTMFVGVPVILSGRILERNLKFKLKVVKEMTTAGEDQYKLADYYEFRARAIPENATKIIDTIYIKLHRPITTVLPKEGNRLVLELVASDIDGMPVLVGQNERSIVIIHILSEPVRPDWWDKEVESTILGDYSAYKYKLFLENIQDANKVNRELIKRRPDLVRKIVLQFKKWLKDNPKNDQYGEQIDVPV